MTKRRRNSGGLYEWANTCDQCLKPRSTGNHAKCSKLRQAANQRGTQEVLPANTTMRRIYISGPMTGLPDFNYPAFNAEAARLRALGYHVENPAENPPQDSWEAYIAVCIPQLLTCDTIALLPGWSESRGALWERYVASQEGITITAAARIRARSAYRGQSTQPRIQPSHRPIARYMPVQSDRPAGPGSPVPWSVQQHQGHGSEQGSERVHRPVPQHC
jgi:hypothetical protein